MEYFLKNATAEQLIALANEDAFKTACLPEDINSFPRLSEVLKSGNKVKRAAAAAIKWMPRNSNSNLGRDKLLM